MTYKLVILDRDGVINEPSSTGGYIHREQDFHNYKDVYANGATQVSLTNEGFHMIKLIEPTLEVIEEYGKITTSFLNEILILNKKNQVLQQTRDLLLPRLMSGKLSVEHLVEETIIAQN